MKNLTLSNDAKISTQLCKIWYEYQVGVPFELNNNGNYDQKHTSHNTNENWASPNGVNLNWSHQYDSLWSKAPNDPFKKDKGGNKLSK